MAKVNLTLTCSVCGKSFTHTHFCQNRRDADSYELWAENNVTCCPACYARQQVKEEGLVGQFGFNLDDAERHPNDTSKHLVLEALGDSYSHKEELKELGYKWGSLGDSHYRQDWERGGEKSWHLVLPYDEEAVKKATADLERLGGKVNPPTRLSWDRYQHIIKQHKEQ
jgi:hypothetical protein